MKHLTLIMLTSVFAFSSLFTAANSLNKKTNKASSTSTVTKKKKKDHCSAIESSVRNIRSIKLLTQELDKYNDKILFDCLKALSSDPSFRMYLKKLEPYLQSRSKKTGRKSSTKKATLTPSIR